MTVRTAAVAAVAVLAVAPILRGAQINVASLRLVHLLSSTHTPCRVHPSLCVPVGASSAAGSLSAAFESFTSFQFSAHAAALARAEAGDVNGAERVWRRTPGALASLNLGRLYWATERDEQALDAWRSAGDSTWLAMLLHQNIEPRSASPATNLLVSFVLDEVRDTYEEHVQAGLIALRFSRYLSALSHFRSALVFRPGDRRLLMRLAQAYGSCPWQQLTRAEHAAIAAQMQAAVRFDPDYSDLHVLAAVSACLGLGDHATAAHEADTARRLGFGRFPDDLTDGLARRCEAVR